MVLRRGRVGGEARFASGLRLLCCLSGVDLRQRAFPRNRAGRLMRARLAQAATPKENCPAAPAAPGAASSRRAPPCAANYAALPASWNGSLHYSGTKGAPAGRFTRAQQAAGIGRGAKPLAQAASARRDRGAAAVMPPRRSRSLPALSSNRLSAAAAQDPASSDPLQSRPGAPLFLPKNRAGRAITPTENVQLSLAPSWIQRLTVPISAAESGGPRGGMRRLLKAWPLPSSTAISGLNSG